MNWFELARKWYFYCVSNVSESRQWWRKMSQNIRSINKWRRIKANTCYGFHYYGSLLINTRCAHVVLCSDAHFCFVSVNSSNIWIVFFSLLFGPNSCYFQTCATKIWRTHNETSVTQSHEVCDLVWLLHEISQANSNKITMKNE